MGRGFSVVLEGAFVGRGLDEGLGLEGAFVGLLGFVVGFGSEGAFVGLLGFVVGFGLDGACKLLIIDGI